MRKIIVPIVSIVFLSLFLGLENSLAELWLCPGTDGIETFTDQGGPGCRRRDDSRRESPEVAHSTQPAQSPVLDVGSRLLLAQIDYDQVHRTLIERCRLSYPESVPALQAASLDWQRSNREPIHELQALWQRGMRAARGEEFDDGPRARSTPDTMTSIMKNQVLKVGQEDLQKACTGGFGATLRSPALNFMSLREQLRGKEELYVASMKRLAAKANSSNPGHNLDTARRCAHAGDANCMIQVADLLMSPSGTPANLQEVREWARKALAKGDQRAGFYLAKAYLADPSNRFMVDGKADHARYAALSQRTVAQRADQIEALEALASSALGGFVPAKLLLVNVLYEQSGGMPGERLMQLFKGLDAMPPVYQAIKKNTEQVSALGPTHASPKLVNDALTTALIGAMGQTQRSSRDMAGCNDFRLLQISQVSPLQDVEWLPLKHPLLANSYPLRGQWTENWTVNLCNASYTVLMQFQADGHGGAYHTIRVQAKAARNTSALSPDLAAATEPTN